MVKAGVIVLSLFFVLCCFTSLSYSEITYKLVTRNIQLTSQVVRENVVLNLENTNGEAKFELAVLAKEAHGLSFIRVESEGAQNSSLNVSSGVPKTTSKNENYVAYEVTLPNKDTSIVLNVVLVFTHSLEPFPASVSQNENQFLKYSGNTFFFSPYKVASQSTTLKLASSKVESNSEKAPFKVKGNTITYGPYSDIPPFSVEELSTHFQSNEPILTVNKLEREVEVSHWGNAAVEETYTITHDGAKLTGYFSRYDYQRTPNGAQTAVKSIKQILPLTAEDIYYRDEIGNISTSHVTQDSKQINLELVPRFPLFGGWKTNFYMGYNLPLSTVLFVDKADSSRHILSITSLPRYDTELVFDDVVTRVILPEGATDVRLKAPWVVDSQSNEKRYTYLDTSGRPVLVFNQHNLVKEHNQHFQVSYRFGRSSVMREPFLLVGAYFLFFLIAIVGVRVNMSIAPEKVKKVKVVEVTKAGKAGDKQKKVKSN